MSDHHRQALQPYRKRLCALPAGLDKSDGLAVDHSYTMSDRNAPTQPGPGAVRFSSHNEEIPPESNLHTIEALTKPQDGDRQELNPEAENEIKQLRTTLQQTVQSSRMQNYAFEPVSLPGSQPISRVSTAIAISLWSADSLAGTIRHDHSLKKIARGIRSALS